MKSSRPGGTDASLAFSRCCWMERKVVTTLFVVASTIDAKLVERVCDDSPWSAVTIPVGVGVVVRNWIVRRPWWCRCCCCYYFLILLSNPCGDRWWNALSACARWYYHYYYYHHYRWCHLHGGCRIVKSDIHTFHEIFRSHVAVGWVSIRMWTWMMKILARQYPVDVLVIVDSWSFGNTQVYIYILISQLSPSRLVLMIAIPGRRRSAVADPEFWVRLMTRDSIHKT